MSNIWTIGYVVLAGVQIIELFLIYQLINYIKKISAKINNSQQQGSINSGLEIGAIVPVFKGKTIIDSFVEFGGKKDYQTIFIFISPSCAYCKNIVPQFRDIEFNEEVKIFVISKGGDSKSLSVYKEALYESNIPLIISEEFVQLLKVNAYPTYLIVDKKGKVIEKDVVRNMNMFEKYGIKKNK